MRLGFLLRSVNPTYCPEILKLKPTDADAFEQIAIDVENTFLTLQVYEAYTPSTVNTYTSSLQSGYTYPAPQQSPASPYPSYQTENNFRSAQRPSLKQQQSRRQSANSYPTQSPR